MRPELDLDQAERFIAARADDAAANFAGVPLADSNRGGEQEREYTRRTHRLHYRLQPLRRSCYAGGFIMPNLHWETAPMSEAVTNGIRVEVLCRYAPENSRPLHREWVFQYTVRITNQSDETVQLLSRHWIITDGLEHVEEVKGPGVVGEQPVLAPGESYKYSSWCPLPTPTGVMRGTYQMVRAGGRSVRHRDRALRAASQADRSLAVQ